MKRKSITFFCFSPPVMLATLLIEVFVLMYVVMRYKFSPITRLVVVILSMLAIFQFSEYMICTGIGLEVAFLARLGFVAITFLPILGLHLTLLIAEKSHRTLMSLAYVSSIIFSLFFIFSTSVFKSYECLSNYAIFQLQPPYGGLYYAYYHFWLFVGISLGLALMLKSQRTVRKTLLIHTIGYISFLLPTGVINAIKPETADAVPSIMCGFAILYALILVFCILPRTNINKKSAMN